MTRLIFPGTGLPGEIEARGKSAADHAARGGTIWLERARR
jgi:hypothetical protein